MSCFLFVTDCPSPLSLPTPISSSYPTLCPAEFSFESCTLERDYMGLLRTCVKPQSISDRNIPASLPTTSSLIHKSSLADHPSPHATLCGSHLKLAPPSSANSDTDDDNDVDDGEPVSVNIGWPPISSYRKSTTKALVSIRPPCSIETTTPLIVHEAPLLDNEEVSHNSINAVDDDDDEKHKASTLMHTNNMKASILRKPLHIKVSMDGTPIMRKVDLDTMQGYHHLSLELHKLFRFYKRHLSCEVGVHSCFKDSNGTNFILTYKDRDGDWMLVGDTTWETFTQSARRIRIMKKMK